MSRSFSINLERFTLGRPIGDGKKLLERKIDVTDVISVLMDEGFTEFNEQRIYHRMHGHDFEGLREGILEKIAGVPRDAYVNISAYGKANAFLLITLEY
ncbi:hypothetical protein D3C79_47970 [compost metagenome]